MDETAPQSTVETSEAGFLERARRRIYVSILLIAAIASSTGFIVNEFTGIASNLVRAILIITIIFALLAAWAIYRRTIPLPVIEEALYLVPGGSLLGVLYFALYLPASPEQSQSALLGFYLWSPAIYVVIFLTHRTRGALLRSAGFYIMILLISLPAALSEAPPGIQTPRMFEQLYFSSSAIVVLLIFVTVLRGRLNLTTLEARNMERLAHTDPLTGLHNRRRSEELLQAELKRAAHEDTPLSVVLFDIDDFKRLNDEFGHDFGDGVIQGFATVVSSSLRRGDELSRWGGEEFLLIASGTAGEDAVRLAERLRLAVEEHDLGDSQVSASFGVASWRRGEDYASLVKKSDTALYRAKTGGKNRVEA